MQSFFSVESLKRVAELLPQDDSLDFTRCVRANGTAYGTGGTCRKGVERPEEESDDQELENHQFSHLLEKRFADNPERKEKLIKGFKLSEKIADEIRKLDNNSTVVVSNHLQIVLKKRINDENEISLTVMMYNKPGKVITFAVNGEFDYGSIKDPKDRFKAALTVRRMFDTVTESLKPGETLHCEAYDEDGKGNKRKKAYEKIGFADDGKGGLVGVVQEGGGVAPPHSYSEDQESLRNWYVALFGELPK